MGEAPVLGMRLADEARRFTPSAEGRALVTGDEIELRHGKEWWIERIVALEPGRLLLLRSEVTGVLTTVRLKDAGPSRTTLEISMCAVPNWDEGDDGGLSAITRDTGRLASDITRLFAAKTTCETIE